MSGWHKLGIFLEHLSVHISDSGRKCVEVDVLTENQCKLQKLRNIILNKWFCNN